MNGGVLLLFGLIYRSFFYGEPIPPEFEKLFTGLIVSGALISIVGLILLSIGLYKRSHRYENVSRL